MSASAQASRGRSASTTISTASSASRTSQTVAEARVEQHRLERVRIERARPIARHRRGLHREPADRAQRRDGARPRRRDARSGRSSARLQRLRRKQPQKGAGAERQQQPKKMGEPQGSERRQHGCGPMKPARLAAPHIFMPFMALMPSSSRRAAPGGALAPIAATGKSTLTEPACSNVSVTLSVSPLASACLRCVNIR